VNFGPGDSLLDFPGRCPHVLKKKCAKKKNTLLFLFAKRKGEKATIGSKAKAGGGKGNAGKGKGLVKQ